MAEEFNLGTDFFETALSQYWKQDVKVLSHSVQPACGKGENFASAVYRAKIHYQTGTSTEGDVSLILKVNGTDESVNEVLEEFQTFDRELTTYKEVFVECDRILKEVGDELNFSPKFVYADSSSLVLEDIGAKGYKTADRYQRLDLSHAELFIKKLAKFHATTVGVYKKNPDHFRYHMNGGLTENETPYHEYFRTTANEFLLVLKQFDDFKPFISHVEVFASDVVNKIKKTFNRSGGEFHVLNHGDCWMNNLLWKHDSCGNVIDVMAVDYQEGFFGSPGIDLNHFLYTSCQVDVVLNHRHELIEQYWRVLNMTLGKLGINQQVGIEDIQKEMENKIDHALIVVACYLPVMLIKNTDHADSSYFFTHTPEAKNVRKIIYEDAQYLDILKKVLPVIIKQK